MRTRQFRRHQAERRLHRRLSEVRNQHQHSDWWNSPRARGRFKEQPQICSCRGCGNQRRYEGAPISERRHLQHDQ